MKKVVFFLMLTLSISFYGWGQREKKVPNFFEVKERLEKKVQKDDKAEDGNNAKYLRWYHLWRYRHGPNGDMTTASKMYNEQMEKGLLKSTGCDSPLDDDIDWTNLGPFNSTGALNYPASGSNACSGLLPGKQNQGRVEEISVNPNNMNEILVGALNGGIWRSTDGGANWVNTTDDEGYSIYGITSIVRHPANSNIVYAATSLGGGAWEALRAVYGKGIIVSEDGGITWKPTGLNWNTFDDKYSSLGNLAIDPNSTLQNTKIYVVSAYKVWSWSGNHLAGGAWGDIYTSYAWSSGPLWYGNVNNNDIAVANNGTVWFTNFKGVFKHENGVTGMVTNYNIPSLFYPSVVVCPGPDFMRRHTNIEINKQGHIVMLMVYNNCLHGIDSDGVTIGQGVKMYLYRSINNGASWSQPVDVTGHVGHNFSNRYPLMTVDPNNSDIIYVEEPYRCVKKTTDFGSTFSFTDNKENHVDVRVLKAYDSGGSNTFFLGTDGGISKMTNGQKWTDITGQGMSITNYYGCGISETNDKMIFTGAQDGSINYYNNGDWYETKPGGDNGDCLINPDDNSMIFQESQNSLHRGTLSGNNVVTASGYPIAIGGWMNPLYWNPATKQEFFVGTNYLYVGKTTATSLTKIDNTLHSNNKKVSSVAVSRSDSNVAYYTTDSYLWRNGQPVDDGIYKATRTNGTWAITDVTGSLRSKHDPTQNKYGLPAPITDIVVDPNDKDRIWVTMGVFEGNHKVYYTSNGGASWQNLTKTGIPNLPCTAISFQEMSNDRLYIGTDNGVYFTDNSMNCWERFGNNGVQCMVSDMEINRCAGKLVIATHGRGLWEAPLITKGEYKVAAGTTIWDTPKKISNDIHVPSGAVLKINNTTVNMGKDIKVVVEPGGRLEVNNSTLTNSCGYTWWGIEVWGKSTLAQNYTNQGVLLLNGATIEHAEEAVQVAKTGSVAFNGGIVQAVNTSFLNNKRSVAYLKYDFPNSGFFKNCDFRTDNNYRHSLTLMTHFSMHAVSGIQILGSTFETTNNWPYSGRVSGITAIDAKFKVSQYNTGSLYKLSIFKGLNRAISTSRTVGSNTFEVSYSDFKNNVYGIITSAHNNFKIQKCRFHVGKTNVSGAPLIHEGIMVMSGTGFSITQNSFYPGFSTYVPFTVGVRVKDAGTEFNEVYKNDFTKFSATNQNLFYGNLANGLNRNLSAPTTGLKYYCNKNVNNIKKGYDFNVSQQGIAYTQGSLNTPAANTFSHGTTATGAPTGSDFRNGATTGNIIYFCKNSGTQVPNNITQVIKYLTSKSNTCPSKIWSEGELELMQIQNDFEVKKSVLDKHQTELKSKIDGGNSDELLTVVRRANNGNADKVLQQLNGISPYLSKEVLFEVMNKKDVFYANEIIELVIENPDVLMDGTVMEKMKKIGLLNDSDKAYINKKVENVWTKRFELELKISDLKQGINEVCNKALIYLDMNAERSSSKDKMTWLKRKESQESDLAIVDMLIHERKYAHALEVLNQVDKKFTLSADEKVELAFFKQLKDIQIKMQMSETTLKDLEASELEQLETIAKQSKRLAGDQARGMLNVDEVHYFIPPVFPDEINPSELINMNSEVSVDGNEKDKRLMAVPNPARSEVTFNYNMKSDGDYKLTVINHQGIVVKELQFTGQQGKETWNCEILSNGIYYYGLTNGEKVVVPYKKLIIIK